MHPRRTGSISRCSAVVLSPYPLLGQVGYQVLGSGDVLGCGYALRMPMLTLIA